VNGNTLPWYCTILLVTVLHIHIRVRNIQLPENEIKNEIMTTDDRAIILLASSRLVDPLGLLLLSARLQSTGSSSKFISTGAVRWTQT